MVWNVYYYNMDSHKIVPFNILIIVGSERTFKRLFKSVKQKMNLLKD